tara:strand:- start:228 stop:1070 length:843 start_codon:yes stop_codon:yes gene_type:complete
MSRNNKSRTADLADTHVPLDNDPPQTTNLLDFIVPKELVDLPSKGQFYPEDHVLHNCEHVEVRHMTTKDEDIITSRTLLQKGLAIPRLIESVLETPVKYADLLSGDKNMILVSTRIFAYGADYKSRIQCPICTQPTEYDFDLRTLSTYGGNLTKYDRTPAGNFLVKLEKTGITAEVRLLTAGDEERLLKTTEHKKQKGMPETTRTDQLKFIIVSLNGETDRGKINQCVLNLPAADARQLLKAYKEIVPDLDMTHHFECPNCYNGSELEVPVTAEFFWPKR